MPILEPVEQTTSFLSEGSPQSGQSQESKEYKAVFGSLIQSDPEAYTTIRQELSTGDTSSTLDEMTVGMDNSYRSALEELIVESKDSTEASEYIEAYRSLTSQGVDVPSLAIKSMTPSLKGVNIHSPLDYIKAQQEKQVILSNILDKEAILREGVVETVEAGAEIFIPLISGGLAAYVTSKTGAELNASNLLFGENVVYLREYIQEGASPEEQTQRAQEVGEAILQYASFNDNSLLTQQLASSVLGDDYGTLERVLDDVFSLATAGFGLAALYRSSKSTVSFIPNPSSPLDVMKDVNKEAAEGIQEAAMKDDGAATSFTGASSSDVMMWYSSPKLSDDVEMLEGSPDSVVANYERAKETAQNVFEETAGVAGRGLSEGEKSAELDRFEKQIDIQGIHLNAGMSVISPTEDGAKISALYMESSSFGFSRVDDAIETVLEKGAVVGIDRKDLSIYAKNSETGVWSKLPEKEVQRLSDEGVEGEYAVAFDTTWEYSPLSVKGYSVDDFKISGWSPVNKVSQAVRWAFDPVNKLPEQMTRLANRMADKSAGAEGKLLGIVEESFKGLKRKSKRKVLNILEKGDRAGEKYTYSQLKSQGLSDAEINGVFSYYTFSDALWRVNNRSLARKLESEGTYLYRHNDLGETYFYNPTTAHPGVYYDPLEGTVRRLDANSLKELEQSGYTFGKFRKDTAIVDQGMKASRILIKRDESTTARAIRQDDVVLNYRKGYYQRKYTGDYYVTKTYKVKGDSGEDVTHAVIVANATNRSKAQSWVDKKNAQEDGATYEVDLSKELSQRLAGSDTAFEIEAGRTIQKKRGKHLEGADNLDQANLADTENPLEAMISAATSTANYATFQRGIANMKANWSKSFGEFSKNKGFPDIDENFLAGRKANTQEFKLAKESRDYIKLMESAYTRTVIDKYWTNSLHTVAEALDALGLDILGKGARSIRDVSPVASIKSLPFVMFIALSPLRQLIVQTGQLSQVLPLTARYFTQPWLLGTDIARTNAILMSKGTKNYDKVLDTMSATSSRTKEEWVSITEAYDKSGLAQTVDKNTLVVGSAKSLGEDYIHDKLAAAAAKVKHYVGAPLRLSKRVGFDAGESNNLLGTFLVAAERYKKLNNIKKLDDLSPSQWEDVADHARKLSWNMNGASKFAYQEGLASIPTQFLQVMHKSILYQFFGNKVLTPAERSKLFAINLIMFGSAGMGVKELTDELRTGDPEADAAVGVVEEGLIDYTVNNFADYLNGETKRTSDVDVGGSLSAHASSYSTALSLLEGLTEGKFSLFDVAPSGTAGGKVFDVLRQTSKVFNEPFEKDETTTDKMLTISKGLGSLSSGFNHYLLYNKGIKTGKIFSSTGNEIAEATLFEIQAKLAGFGTNFEKQYYEALKDQKELTKMVNEAADIYYKDMKTIYTKYKGDSKEMDLKLRILRGHLLGVPTEHQEIFKRRILTNIKRDVTTGEDSALRLIMRSLQQNSVSKSQALEMVEAIPTPDKRETAIRLIEATFAND